MLILAAAAGAVISPEKDVSLLTVNEHSSSILQRCLTWHWFLWPTQLDDCNQAWGGLSCVGLRLESQSNLEF